MPRGRVEKSLIKQLMEDVWRGVEGVTVANRSGIFLRVSFAAIPVKTRAHGGCGL